MNITVSLTKDEIAFLDALTAHDSTDRSTALRIAISCFRQELNVNGPTVLTMMNHPFQCMDWRFNWLVGPTDAPRRGGF